MIVFPLVGEGQHPGLHSTHEEIVIGTCRTRVVQVVKSVFFMSDLIR